MSCPCLVQHSCSWVNIPGPPPSLFEGAGGAARVGGDAWRREVKLEIQSDKTSKHQGKVAFTPVGHRSQCSTHLLPCARPRCCCVCRFRSTSKSSLSGACRSPEKSRKESDLKSQLLVLYQRKPRLQKKSLNFASTPKLLVLFAFSGGASVQFTATGLLCLPVAPCWFAMFCSSCSAYRNALQLPLHANGKRTVQPGRAAASSW